MSEGSEQSRDSFAESVDKLTRWVEAGEAGDSETWGWVVRSVESYLRRFGLSAADRSDIASEAVSRFVISVGAGKVRTGEGAGLLTVMARNAAIDSIRRGEREVPFADIESSVGIEVSKDDQIAALLDRGADGAAISCAMGLCLAGGDVTTARIVRAWLDLADEWGRAPSAREVAKVLSVSHTTVVRSLRIFRSYVPKRAPETKTGREI